MSPPMRFAPKRQRDLKQQYKKQQAARQGFIHTTAHQIGRDMVNRATQHAPISPGRFGKGMEALHKNLKEFRARNDQRLVDQESNLRNDIAGFRKGEQRTAAI
ncbi:MAG: hypothetical protein Q7R47_02285, partial [Candidatus Diapherotrites archaeon]|nr:hypothetical protein [Candidatus Diapherotrites archaeon]